MGAEVRLLSAVALLLLPGLCEVRSQVVQPRETKTWHFKTQQGDLTVKVNAGLPGRPRASSIALSAEGPDGPTLAEEVGVLRQTLQQMETIGADPHDLAFIHLFIQEPDVRAKLAIAAAQSERWRMLRTKAGGNAVVAELLNALGAYDAFNEPLGQYGLQVARIGGVEEILVEKFVNLHLKNSPHGIDGATPVPTGASIYIEVGKKAGGSRK